jgi:hypothetical protein
VVGAGIFCCGVPEKMGFVPWGRVGKLGDVDEAMGKLLIGNFGVAIETGVLGNFGVVLDKSKLGAVSGTVGKLPLGGGGVEPKIGWDSKEGLLFLANCKLSGGVSPG